MNVSAQVVLINEEGMVLGVSRKTDHSDFGLPGGKMEAIDNIEPKITAIREVFEETGLQISNLRLIFAMHKDGYMGYTYLADFKGEINHNEPHVVKWVPYQALIMGSFGKYNKLVLESLNDMGIEVIERPNFDNLKEKIATIVNNYGYTFSDLKSCNNSFEKPCIEVHFTYANGKHVKEEFYDFRMVSEIVKFGDENGVTLVVPLEYLPK